MPLKLPRHYSDGSLENLLRPSGLQNMNAQQQYQKLVSMRAQTAQMNREDNAMREYQRMQGGGASQADINAMSARQRSEIPRPENERNANSRGEEPSDHSGWNAQNNWDYKKNAQNNWDDRESYDWAATESWDDEKSWGRGKKSRHGSSSDWKRRRLWPAQGK